VGKAAVGDSVNLEQVFREIGGLMVDCVITAIMIMVAVPEAVLLVPPVMF
jgi:hypothetical protein